MTGFVLAEGTHQMPGRLWILIGRYQDGILRLPRNERKLILKIGDKEEVRVEMAHNLTKYVYPRGGSNP
jgi:hypothetical protein